MARSRSAPVFGLPTTSTWRTRWARAYASESSSPRLTISRATEAPRSRGRRAREPRLAPEEPGERGERRAERRRRRELPHDGRERGGVLPAERGAQLTHARGLGGELLAEAAEEVRVAQHELEALEAERPEALDRHRDDLDLRLRLLQADQLDARLVELPVVRHPRLVVAEDVGHVGEADRLGLVAQARPPDARDLRRDVGAEREQAAGLAGPELEPVLLPLRVGAR